MNGTTSANSTADSPDSPRSRRVDLATFCGAHACSSRMPDTGCVLRLRITAPAHALTPLRRQVLEGGANVAQEVLDRLAQQADRPGQRDHQDCDQQAFP